MREAFDCVFPPDRDQRWHERVGQIPEWLVFVYGRDAGKAEASSEARIEVRDAADIDPTQIPPRGWLLGAAFCRTFISGLIRGGAVGKTAVRYAQYLAAVSGVPVTGETVHRRAWVLIVCLEDDLREVRRRIGAAMLHLGIDRELRRGWLLYCCPKGLKLLQTDTRGHRPSAGYTQLETIIPELKIDIVSIDPFVKAPWGRGERQQRDRPGVRQAGRTRNSV